MKAFTTFDAATGRPTADGIMPNNIFKTYDQPGVILHQGKMAATHYWDGSDVAEKVPLSVMVPPAAVTGGSIDIAGIPIGAIVKVDADEHAHDGTMTITFDSPGKYLVQIDSVQYIYQEWTVTVDD